MNEDDSMRIKNEANFFMRKLDTFPALYQRGIVTLWTAEVWEALWSTVIIFITIKHYSKMKESS